jgi:hypothetical protein
MKSVLKAVKKKDEEARYQVREIAKPSNVVMESRKVHCDEYCQKSNAIMGSKVFESVPMT